MKKVWILSLLLLVSVLCSCTMAGNTQGQQEAAKGEEALRAGNLNASRNSDFCETLKQAKTVRISHYGQEIATVTDSSQIQALIQSLAKWDKAANQTEAEDLICEYTVQFGDISINCNLDDAYCVIFVGASPDYFYLPQSFLDALAKLVPTESGLDSLYERLKNAKTVTVSTYSYEINGGEGLVVSYDQSIANLANALRDWDAQKNRTEAQDMVCPWTVCFDGVEISCSFLNSYSVVHIDSEIYFCYLPQEFYAVLQDWILS